VRIVHPLLAVLILGGCAGSFTNRLTLPDRNTLVRDQLVIHGDFPLAAHHRLFEELTAERTDLCNRLGIPCSDEPIHIYLFENQKRFEDFMRLHHPEFPNRRAFFVETDAQLSVYAQWGDRMAEDLRHETAHGYLHSIAPDAPLWLDEGIAEFFEVPRSQRGLNRPHLDRLLVRIQREHWQPNLERLEKLPPTQDMSQDDYGEAWIWTHFLLESQPDRLELVRAYFSDLRRNGVSTPISARLLTLQYPPTEELLAHIHDLETGKWQ